MKQNNILDKLVDYGTRVLKNDHQALVDNLLDHMDGFMHCVSSRKYKKGFRKALEIVIQHTQLTSQSRYELRFKRDHSDDRSTKRRTQI